MLNKQLIKFSLYNKRHLPKRENLCPLHKSSLMFRMSTVWTTFFLLFFILIGKIIPMARTGLLMQVTPISLCHLSQIALVSLIEFNPDNYDCKESKYFNDDRSDIL